MSTDPVLDKLTCAICLEIVNVPRQCSNGHLFCLNCVEQWLSKFKNCPCCKIDLFENTLSRSLIAEVSIEGYTVVCHKRHRDERKCGWFGPANAKNSHTCDFSDNHSDLIGRQILRFDDSLQKNAFGEVVKFCSPNYLVQFANNECDTFDFAEITRMLVPTQGFLPQTDEKVIANAKPFDSNPVCNVLHHGKVLVDLTID